VALVQPEDGRDWHTGAEPIRIDARRLSGANAANLVLELDGTDVTEWARRDGTDLVLELPTPPAPGVRRVQVYEYRDPNWIDHGGVDVDVRGSGTVHEAWLRTNVDAELGRRVRDNGFRYPNETDRTEGRASVRVSGRLGTRWGTLDVYAPLLYDSNAPYGSFDKTWTLADYLAEAEMGRLSARVGHHYPALPSLIFEGFGRRGVSAAVELPGGLTVSGFTFRTDPVVGFRESFGVRDEERRLVGGSITSREYDFGIGRVSVGGTWYQASADRSGAAVAENPSGREDGTAWTSVVDASFLHDRIRLRGEYARTDFDFDGGGGRDGEDDRAWSGELVLNPFPNLVLGEHPVAFQLYYAESEVGTFFRALGNPGKAPDLRTRSAGVDFQWAGFALAAEHARYTDNREDFDDQTTYRNDNWRIDLSYTPHWLTRVRESGLLRYLGTPTVRVGWWRQRHKPIANAFDDVFVEDPTTGDFFLLQGASIDETQRQAYASIGTRWRRGRVDLSQTIIRTDDAVREDSDVTSNTRSFSYAFYPSRRFSIDGFAQLGSTRFRDPTFETWNFTAQTGIRTVLLPDRLFAETDVSWTKNWDQENLTDSRALIYSATWTWKMIHSRGHRPGFTLALQGAYRDDIDQAANARDRDAYQTFLRLTIDWQGTLGEAAEAW